MIKNKKFKKIAKQISDNMKNLVDEFDNLDDEDFNNSCDKYPFDNSFDEMAYRFEYWVNKLEGIE